MKGRLKQAPFKTVIGRSVIDSATTVIDAISVTVIDMPNATLKPAIPVQHLSEKYEGGFLSSWIVFPLAADPKSWSDLSLPRPRMVAFKKHHSPELFYLYMDPYRTPPHGYISVKGIELQNDPKAPYDSGYYLAFSDSDLRVITTSPPVLPSYTIAQVRSQDSIGYADSVGGTYCHLRGIVQSTQCYGTQMFFSIFDSTGSIMVINQSGNYGYGPTPGDSIHIIGTIDQNVNTTRRASHELSFYSGMTFIRPDTFWLISGSYKLKPPIIVKDLLEVNEAQLVRMNHIRYYCCWRDKGQRYGIKSVFLDSTLPNFVDVGIPPLHPMFYHAPPDSGRYYDVTGILCQWDVSITGGRDYYSIIPRDTYDVVRSGYSGVEETNSSSSMSKPNLTIFPNPAQNEITLSFNDEQPNGMIQIIDGTGRIVLQQGVAYAAAQATIDVSMLNAGIYTVIVSGDGGQYLSSKFVKQ